MAENDGKKKTNRFLEPPRLALISDAPIESGDAGADDFDLGLRVGPIYDILRHPLTGTPMACAIYGSWGTGKTSAMRWLEGRLGEWNRDGKVGQGKKKIKVRTVRFHPWKYQKREDVWRGLIAEIILACLDRLPKSKAGLLKEAQDIAKLLGRSIADVFSGLTLEGGVAKFSLKGLQDIEKHAGEYLHPEAAYLNEFESVFKSWVERSLGKNERLVVFIDDLDRCMPEITLQVLEALKLYLDVPKLIFVIGVDDKVVNTLVTKHYKELGLEEEKAKDYLSKMFQVQVTLAQSERQIDDFLNRIIKDNQAWGSDDKKTQEILRGVIGRLAERSPREIKRLVNSSLMAGAGARMSALEEEGKAPPTVEQGMQVFLVHWILDRRYTRGTLVGQKIGTEFFLK